jgi:hypothetical protein
MEGAAVSATLDTPRALPLPWSGMGLVASWIVVYFVAGAMLIAALSAGVALAAWHRRRSRIAAYALDPGAPITEGPALLRGHVEAEEGAPPGPVLEVEVASGAPPGGGGAPAWRVRARSFSLRLPAGAVVRVEPGEDAERLAMDQTFRRTSRDGEVAYAAAVHAGELVHLEGAVRREIDPRASGRGYRDAAQAWVLRAPARGRLRLVSEDVIALHARRARFHLGWSIALGVGLAGLHGVVLREVHARLFDAVLGASAPAGRIFLGAGEAALALAIGFGLPFAYRIAAEQTRPWLERRVAA